MMMITPTRHLLALMGLLFASLCLPFSLATAQVLNLDPNPHARETIGTVREVYDGKLPPDIQANTFRNIHRLFPTRRVARGTSVSDLPRQRQFLDDFSFVSAGITYDIYDVLALNRVAAMAIVKDGVLVFEDYYMGNSAATRWMSMSVVKTISVMLIGAAVQGGHIDSLSDPVTKYLPRFIGTAYDEVTVEQIIGMTSGVAWNETYTDPTSDRRRMLDAQISQQPGAILDLMAALPRATTAGSRWNYSTGETHIAGALIEAATGQWAADYLSATLWQPLGMESDASWWLESAGGLEVGGSGLSATLRDYTRFGLFLLNEGVIDGESVVPPGFVQQAASRQLINGESVDYGWGLWPLHDNSYAAIGIFGQYVFVDPDRDLVVTLWSAQPKPVGRDGINEYDFLQALSDYFDN